MAGGGDPIDTPENAWCEKDNFAAMHLFYLSMPKDMTAADAIMVFYSMLPTLWGYVMVLTFLYRRTTLPVLLGVNAAEVVELQPLAQQRLEQRRAEARREELPEACAGTISRSETLLEAP